MERLIDVENRHLRLLRELLSAYLTNKTVWAYGSRVKWKASPVSDLDLVVWRATGLEVANAKDAFVESDLPFTVQLLVWEDIPEDFKENIRKKYVVLQEGNKTPKGWREVRLGEVAELSKATWKVGDEQFPYVGLENIDEDKLRLNSVGNSSDVESNKYRFKSGDTLFGKLRPYFRKVVKPDFDGICSTDIWVIRPKKNADKGFLFYFFANKELVEISTSSSSGTRMPRADWDFLSQTVWNIPPLPEQKAIAEVLSSLDDKIDLLHRQNKTLENIAQTLFRQWFVEEADEGWERKPLDEIANYLNGLACQKYPPQNENDKLPVLKIKELKDGINNTSDWVSSEIDKKYIVELGDVIFSWSGSLVIKMWDGENCVLNQHLFKIESNKYPKWFYYLWTNHHMEKFIKIAESKATTMGHIKRSDLSSSLALTPPDSGLQWMNKTMNPLLERVVANYKKICTIENLRDAFLPKLMDGKIRLKKEVPHG